MLRARSLAAHCARELSRSRCHSVVGGAALCNTADRLPGGCHEGSRSCSSSSSSSSVGGIPGSVPSQLRHTSVSETSVFSADASRRLLHSNTAATEGAEAGGLQQQHSGKHEEERSLQDEELMKLTERLNSLNSVDDPHVSEEGMRLLEVGRSRGIKDLRVYNAVFQLLSVERNADVITRLAELMKEDGVKPDLTTYNLMICGYASSKDVARAQRTYEELAASSDIEENGAVLSNMVVAHAWGRVSDMKRYLEIIRAKGLTPSLTAYHSIVLALRRAEDWKGIEEAIHAMLADGIVPSQAAFGIGFLTARNLLAPDFAKLLLERYGQAGMPPRQDFFVSVMVALSVANRSEELLEHWRQLVCVRGVGGLEIKPETFFLALRSAVKIKAWDEVEAILGMMQDDGKRMDEKVQNALLGQQPREKPIAATDVADVERLVEISEQVARHGGVGLKPWFSLKLAAMCAGAKMYDRAMPLFDAAKRGGMLVAKSDRLLLLRTLLARGEHEEIKKMWTQATYLIRKEFTGSVFQLFMRVAERLSDADWALELHEDSLRGKKSQSRWFHPTAVKILAQAGRLEDAFRVSETLRTGGHTKAPPTSYHVMCRCCKERGDKELIVKVVEVMRKGNLSLYLPPPGVLGFVVEAFTENGKAREVISLFDRMRAHRIQPDPDVYVLLADAAVAANDQSKAVLFVEMVRKVGLRASEAAIAFAEGSPPPETATAAAAAEVESAP
ncbi:unnamed protein product [Pylaiella littoralis]